MKQFTRLDRDLRAALAVFNEIGDLTPGVESPLRTWFQDVPFPQLPIAVMEMTEEERHTLIRTVLEEMVAICAAAPVKHDDSEAFTYLAPLLDPLWKELVSLRAEVFNKELAKMRSKLEEIKEAMDLTPEELAESVLSMSLDEAIEESRENAQVRLVLQVLGLI
jgi:hypothetical protein